MSHRPSRTTLTPPPAPSSSTRPAATPSDLARQARRDVSRAQRDLDREHQALRRDEARIVAEVKRLSAAGQHSAARFAAKSLVANRKQQEKLLAGRYQIGGVVSQVSTMKATAAMGDAMGKANHVMAAMGTAVDGKSTLDVVKEYDKQTQKMELTEEMMGDAVDAALGDDDVDVESEEVLASVLDEIGMEYKSKMSVAPTARPAPPKTAAAQRGASDAEVEDLMAQLAKMG